MLHLTKGDILKSEAEALVNTVNCVGVMGRGIALQFKKAYPKNFKAYKVACEAKEVRPGKMFLFDLNQFYNPRYIINFPTKRHWRGKSRMEDVKAGLVDLITVVQDLHIHSIAIPPLGCGLGGLDWTQVRPLIVEAFAPFPQVEVYLFEPMGTPQAAQMVKTSEVPNMTPGRAALLGLMRRYLSAVFDPNVTLLEIHKLMYFMQEAGEDLRLHYEKGIYGPYAKNLRHVLNHIEGHFITGFGDASEKPDTPLVLNPQAAEQAEVFLAQREATRQRFDRVAQLIEGFESAFGMELLATVHWVATRDEAQTPEDAVKIVHDWNPRKKMFEPRHIQLAWERLHKAHWVS